MSDTSQLILFNYSTLSPDTAEFVQRRTLEIRAFHKRTAESIVQIGLRLIEVKETLGHGQFLGWLEAEFGWSDRTARNYMYVAEKMEKFSNLGHYDTSAMYLLAAPSTPEAVLDKAREMTIEGEYITHAKAQELLSKHKEPEQEQEPEQAELPQDIEVPTEEQEPMAQPERHICPECGEVLTAEVWHCLYCHCHWPLNVPRCLSCGMPHVSGSLIAVVKELVEQAPDLLEQVRQGEKTIPQAKRELVQRQKTDPPPLPDNKYRVWYADPPWKYGNDGVIGDTDNYGHVGRHYPSMTISELCAMGQGIRAKCTDNAVLFLWVTSPLLAECFDVINAWGFQYKTSFVWDKVRHNYGHYNSVRHEFLLICTRGSCTPDVPELIDSVQSIERTDKHSEKPEEFRQIIDTLYPHGKRIELFARCKVDGWDSWGNESI